MKVLFKTLLIASFLFSMNTFAGDGENENKGFDTKQMDNTIKPQNDFYRFAVGNWLKNNPIPEEYSRWGSFEILAERNNEQLKTLLKEVSAKDAKKGSIEQKVGDFYYSGMDTARIEKLGYKPIEPYLKKIESLNSKGELEEITADFHMAIANPFFFFYTEPDAKNSEVMAAYFYQGGIGLPERDYYVVNNERFNSVKSKYLQHVKNMFMLIGKSEDIANRNADFILDIETKLAEDQMTKEDRRDPQKTYNKMSVADLQKMAPNFNWQQYFAGLGLGDLDEIIVGMPDFIKGVSDVIENETLENIKIYLTWNLIRSSAPYLSSDFVNENFDFYGKTLTGSETIRPRWKRMLSSTNSVLGEALGELYVEKYFSADSKARVKELVNNLIKAMENSINNLEWMSDETKKQALIKLSAFDVKIGYPDKWKDYSDLEITKDSYFKNLLNGSIFAMKKEIEKVGKPVDKTEWGMTPQTVNAYYHPLRNEIVFPAGILQPPFFDPNADDAINYGGIGAVIGHEITHGFDDQGRQYDAEGNIRDWWTAEDNERFNKRAQKIIDQYDEFSPLDSVNVNGTMTQGENIADLGGLTIALAAYKMTDEYKANKKIDGFSPEQRFFLGWAQVWKNNIREANLLLRINTDPHSPGEYRVNGPLVNMPEFFKAFNVKEGDPMMREKDKQVKIW